jgi:hypothetical protein
VSTAAMMEACSVSESDIRRSTSSQEFLTSHQNVPASRVEQDDRARSSSLGKEPTRKKRVRFSLPAGRQRLPRVPQSNILYGS